MSTTRTTINDDELIRLYRQGITGRKLAVALGLRPSQESSVRYAIKRLGLTQADQEATPMNGSATSSAQLSRRNTVTRPHRLIVTEIAQAAIGHWGATIFPALGVDVPKRGKHGPCPVCGGTDRFHFDDKEGRGTWHCRGCDGKQAGDGLALVMKATNKPPKEAALLVAGVLGLDAGNIDQATIDRNRQRAERRKQQDAAEREHKIRNAKTKAASILASCESSTSNAYLVAKGIDYPAMVLTKGPEIIHTKEKVFEFNTGDLVVPLYNAAGELVNVQLIQQSDTGSAKCYLPGGQKQHAYHLIAGREQAELVAVVEGYATGLSVHLATGSAVYVAFDAGNLPNVTRLAREKHPAATLAICGDNDNHRKGEQAAINAAAATGGHVVLCPEPGDWNDYHQRHGLDATSQAITAGLNPPAVNPASQEEQPMADQANVISMARSNLSAQEMTGLPGKVMAQTVGDTHFYIEPEKTCTTCTNEPETPVTAGIAQLKPVPKPIPNLYQPVPEEHQTIGDITLTDEEHARLVEMNHRYCHAPIGGKHFVVMLAGKAGKGIDMETVQQFPNRFRHLPKIGSKRNLGAAWLDWPGKHYKPGGIGFYPNPANCPDDVLNLFTGLAVESAQGDVEPYLYHLQQVICGGDEAAYRYLVGWLAHLVQKPEQKPSVAIVMKSVEGTGKGTAVRPILQILGRYGIQTNGPEQIAGKFNATLANKLLIFADEVDLTSRATADKLKAIISEPTVNLERKGIDPEPIDNYARLIFASNHDKVLRAGIRERRYLVLEPSDIHAQDHAYFARLNGWIRDNGPAHLLDYLLRFDLASFSPHKAPNTPALLDEKLSSLSPALKYLYGELEQDKPFDGAKRIYATLAVEHYLTWCEQNDEMRTPAAARTELGKALAKLGMTGQGRSDRGKGKFYDLPQNDELKRNFSALLGETADKLF